MLDYDPHLKHFPHANRLGTNLCPIEGRPDTSGMHPSNNAFPDAKAREKLVAGSGNNDFQMKDN
jgi:hypothetical protein